MNSLNISAQSGIRWPISRKCLLIYFAAAACLLLPLPADAQSRKVPGVRSIQLVQNENGLKTIYHVMLDRRFKVYELDTLARNIKREAPGTPQLSIFYFLRGMDRDQGAWATSNYNPSLATFEIQINEIITATNPPDTDLRIGAR